VGEILRDARKLAAQDDMDGWQAGCSSAAVRRGGEAWRVVGSEARCGVG
jgi:hypothetical protein